MLWSKLRNSFMFNVIQSFVTSSPYYVGFITPCMTLRESPIREAYASLLRGFLRHATQLAISPNTEWLSGIGADRFIPRKGAGLLYRICDYARYYGVLEKLPILDVTRSNYFSDFHTSEISYNTDGHFDTYVKGSLTDYRIATLKDQLYDNPTAVTYQVLQFDSPWLDSTQVARVLSDWVELIYCYAVKHGREEDFVKAWQEHVFENMD